MCQNLIYLSNVVQYGKASDAEVKVIMQVTDVSFKMTQSKKKKVNAKQNCKKMKQK